MKRKFVAATLATVLTFTMLLGGCGQKQEETPEAPAETTEEAPAEEAETSASAWKPEKPVTVICPYGAGGGQDVAARLFAQYAEKYAGVKFVVENKTGGSGTIGNTAIATANPDGYTLGMFHNLSLYDQYLVDGVTYNEESFTQLAIFCADSTVIVANKNLGVSSIDELVALAKEKPGQITWGGPEFSSQTYPRMNVENASGVEFGKMIFDGGANSLAAVAGGNCGVTSVFPSEYFAMADNEDIVAIATTGEERMEAVGDIPTMKEQGVDATFYQWRSFVLPAGAADEVVAFYDDVFTQVIADTDFQKELADGGFNLLEVAGHEAATEYMLADFEANKDAIMSAANGSN
ncbi:MAG: tripartite tricarboxylate transporter substrate binding protein [Clostridiales bacterium]|nr:tripartite tricarboxylate transporter substrate binding protein [Clostridiales bacterium]